MRQEERPAAFLDGAKAIARACHLGTVLFLAGKPAGPRRFLAGKPAGPRRFLAGKPAGPRRFHPH